MPISPHEALQRIILHREIHFDDMIELMRQVMRGEVSPTMTAALLIGLRVKKESVAEIAAAASVVREFATSVHVPNRVHLVDIVGTGGDASQSFNISTAATFVVAAAGARVAKHGNLGLSSNAGSANALHALGAEIELQPAQVAQCIREAGIGYMYAPIHHPALRHIALVRKELGVRTLFNILGPLTNPACVPNVLMGVFHEDLVGIQARVLRSLGTSRALVVHGRDGMDEISLCAPTLVAELDAGGALHEYELDPTQFGLNPCTTADLRVNDAQQSCERILEALADSPGAARDIVALNAGAALYVAGISTSIADGLARARAVMASGAARSKLDEFVALTRRLAVHAVTECG